LVAPRIVITGLRHRRGLGDGLVHLDDEMAQHCIAESECASELGERLAIAFDVHEDVVRLVDLRDRIRELAPAPIFKTMNDTVTGCDHRLIAFQHRRNLFTLVGMDQKYDLVMAHLLPPYGDASRAEKPRSSKELWCPPLRRSRSGPRMVANGRG